MNVLQKGVPKVVDPDARRLAVTDAVFRVICRDGLEGASLRNIADEAGLAIGSVRHYFSGHTDVIVFALAALRARLDTRILGHLARLPAPGAEQSRVDLRAVAENLLSEFLPLDDARRQETTVWLAFVSAARTRPELAPLARELYDGMRMVVRKVIERAEQAGLSRDGLDTAVETERLSALLDGLAMNAILQPDLLSSTALRRVLSVHLDSLGRHAPESPIS